MSLACLEFACMVCARGVLHACGTRVTCDVACVRLFVRHACALHVAYRKGIFSVLAACVQHACGVHAAYVWDAHTINAAC